MQQHTWLFRVRRVLMSHPRQSVIEYYRLNTPLFLPSLRLSVQWEMQHRKYERPPSLYVRFVFSFLRYLALRCSTPPRAFRGEPALSLCFLLLLSPVLSLSDSLSLLLSFARSLALL